MGRVSSGGTELRADRIGHLCIAAVMVVVLVATTIVVVHQTDDPVLIGYWWFGMSVISFCVIAFVIGRRYLKNEPAPGRVLCIVPTFNEPTEHLHACIDSLLAQDYPVDIHVIDDGSEVPAEVYHHPRVVWHSQANTGKRGAQVNVLRYIEENYGQDYYEYVLTVDSDSRPYPNALRELLRAMNQDRSPDGERRIWAATGMIYIRNYAQSWVSRAADMDIGSSCVMMRASRSMLGALETTSGALALYPSRLLFDHLEAYAVECGTGDDRWLALRALERGEVVGVAEAGVVTEMPTTLRGTYKQRLRWARSWWWMLPYVFRNLSFKQLISPMYGLTQLLVAPVMIVWALVGFVMTAGARYEGSFAVTIMYLGAYLTVRFGLSGLYLVGRPDMPLREKVKSFFLGTVQATLLNVFWLMPIRYVALFKLMDNRWQSREVTSKPKHAYAGTVYRGRRWVDPKLALASAVLLAGVGISLYALTGGKEGPAQFAFNPSTIGDASNRIFNEPHIFPTTSEPKPTPVKTTPAPMVQPTQEDKHTARPEPIHSHKPKPSESSKPKPKPTKTSSHPKPSASTTSSTPSEQPSEPDPSESASSGTGGTTIPEPEALPTESSSAE